MSLPVIAVYIILAGVLFTLGALTVLLRRNAIIELMGLSSCSTPSTSFW